MKRKNIIAIICALVLSGAYAAVLIFFSVNDGHKIVGTMGSTGKASQTAPGQTSATTAAPEPPKGECENDRHKFTDDGICEICGVLDPVLLVLEETKDAGFCISAKADAVLPKEFKIAETYFGISVTEIKDDGFNADINGALKKVEKIVLPKTLIKIGYQAFSYCSSLRELVLPEGLSEMGERCFWWCESLEKIDLPKSIRAIPINAFTNCLMLREIFIPKNIKSIGASAFYGCSSLKKIEFEELGVQDPSVLSCHVFDMAFAYCSSLENAEFPKGVELRGTGIFMNCTALVSVTVESSLSILWQNTFKNCISLENVNLNLKGSIGESAFAGCKSLKTFSVPEGAAIIYGNAFNGCSSLESIEIPYTVTSVREDSLANCVNLKTIRYGGMIGEWNSINKSTLRGSCTVKCLNGEISIES